MKARRFFRKERATRGAAPDALGTRPRRVLQRAHHLMEVGDHQNASVLLEELAHAARDMGLPRRAAQLLLQAGRAQLLAGQAQAGEDRVRQGLEIYQQAGQWEALGRLGRHIALEMNQLGFSEEAARIETWLAGALQGHVDPAQEAALASGETPERGHRLPLKCPLCGATVQPNEIETLEDGSAGCAYCGGMLPER